MPRRATIPSGLTPLFVLAAIMDSALGSILALLAEIRAQFGIDEFGIGLIGGSGFVTAFAAQVALARLADRGHARALLNFGLVTAAISMAVLAHASSLWAFVLGRLMLGLGEGAILPAARRIVIVRSGADAGTALGRLNAFQMSGFLIGPMYGSMVYGLLDLRAVFLTTLAMVVCCVPLVARTIIPDAVPSSGHRVLRTLLRKRGMRAMICMGIGYYGSFGLYEAIWAIFLADRGASQWLIGLNLTLFTVPMILVAPWGGAIATRFGAMRVAFLAMAADDGAGVRRRAGDAGQPARRRGGERRPHRVGAGPVRRVRAGRRGAGRLRGWRGLRRLRGHRAVRGLRGDHDAVAARGLPVRPRAARPSTAGPRAPRDPRSASARLIPRV
jgi:MFS family permease